MKNIAYGHSRERTKVCWLNGIYPREIKGQAYLEYAGSKCDKCFQTYPGSLPPVTCSPQHLLTSKLVTHRAETVFLSSFPGPVGFQSNNINMNKGMFTSIGTVLESSHPTTPFQSEAIWGNAVHMHPSLGITLSISLAPALSLLSFLNLDPNGYHIFTPSLLCPIPLV